MKKILAALLFILSVPAQAQTPTVVYGASETAPGQKDQFMLIQPEDEGNPLGNPLYNPPATTSGPKVIQPQDNTVKTLPHKNLPENIQDAINQSATQDPAPFSENLKQQQNQIQNTLYQGGDRIYDVQSYPLNDIKTITEPNIQPTITTYPEY